MYRSWKSDVVERSLGFLNACRDRYRRYSVFPVDPPKGSPKMGEGSLVSRWRACPFVSSALHWDQVLLSGGSGRRCHSWLLSDTKIRRNDS